LSFSYISFSCGFNTALSVGLYIYLLNYLYLHSDLMKPTDLRKPKARVKLTARVTVILTYLH